MIVVILIAKRRSTKILVSALRLFENSLQKVVGSGCAINVVRLHQSPFLTAQKEPFTITISILLGAIVKELCSQSSDFNETQTWYTKVHHIS